MLHKMFLGCLSPSAKRIVLYHLGNYSRNPSEPSKDHSSPNPHVLHIPPPGAWFRSPSSGVYCVSGGQMYPMGKQPLGRSLWRHRSSPALYCLVQHVLPNRKTFPKGFSSPCELSVLNAFIQTIVLSFSPPLPKQFIADDF